MTCRRSEASEGLVMVPMLFRFRLVQGKGSPSNVGDFFSSFPPIAINLSVTDLPASKERFRTLPGPEKADPNPKN